MAIFRASEFITKINDLGGPARTNKFDVEITVPEGVKTHFTDKTEFTFESSYLSILCDSASIPYKSIGTSEHRINGFSEFKPHSINFDRQTTLNFVLNDGIKTGSEPTNGHYIKAFFDSWMDYIIDSNDLNQSNFYLRYFEQYAGEIKVTPRKIDLGKISETTMYGVFPINVGALSYNQRESNISTLTVIFAFDRWIVNYNI